MDYPNHSKLIHTLVLNLSVQSMTFLTSFLHKASLYNCSHITRFRITVLDLSKLCKLLTFVSCLLIIKSNFKILEVVLTFDYFTTTSNFIAINIMKNKQLNE